MHATQDRLMQKPVSMTELVDIGGTRSPSDERGKLQSPELVRMQTAQNQKDHKVRNRVEGMKIRGIKKRTQ